LKEILPLLGVALGESILSRPKAADADVLRHIFEFEMPMML
jgi:hypothetical protein